MACDGSPIRPSGGTLTTPDLKPQQAGSGVDERTSAATGEQPSKRPRGTRGGRRNRAKGKPSPFTFHCPACHAQPGRGCKNGLGTYCDARVLLAAGTKVLPTKRQPAHGRALRRFGKADQLRTSLADH